MVPVRYHLRWQMWKRSAATFSWCQSFWQMPSKDDLIGSNWDMTRTWIFHMMFLNFSIFYIVSDMACPYLPTFHNAPILWLCYGPAVRPVRQSFLLNLGIQKALPTAAMERFETSEFFASPPVMAMAMPLVGLHIYLTKSEVKLGLARLLEKCQQHKHVMTQRELDKKRRFEKELLQARIRMFRMVQRVAIHIAFALLLASMYGAVATGRPASWVQLCKISTGYGVHAFVQSALVEIKSASHIRFLEAAFLFSYAVHLYGVADGTWDVLGHWF